MLRRNLKGPTRRAEARTGREARGCWLRHAPLKSHSYSASSASPALSCRQPQVPPEGEMSQRRKARITGKYEYWYGAGAAGGQMCIIVVCCPSPHLRPPSLLILHHLREPHFSRLPWEYTLGDSIPCLASYLLLANCLDGTSLPFFAQPKAPHSSYPHTVSRLRVQGPI